MGYRFRKLLALHREQGIEGMGRGVLDALRSRLDREEEHLVLVKALDGVPGPPARRPLDVRAIGDDDTDEVLAFTAEHSPPKVLAFVRNYLANGYRAFGAFRDGRLIGLFWWVDAALDAEHPDLVLHEIGLEPGDAYGFAYFVAPEHRGGGTATDFLSRVFVALHEARYTRMWGWVLADNRPARWLFSLAGFREVRRIRARTVVSLLTFSERRVLVRNLGWRSRHAFGSRRLLAEEHPGPSVRADAPPIAER
jgi:GNAT superfamily N-acetyltransferase